MKISFVAAGKPTNIFLHSDQHLELIAFRFCQGNAAESVKERCWSFDGDEQDDRAVHAHGTGNIDHYTSSTHAIMETVLDLYDRVVNKKLLIRRVNIAACNLISEDDIPEDKPLQLDMFTDYEQLEKDTKVRRAAEEKERKL